MYIDQREPGIEFERNNKHWFEKTSIPSSNKPQKDTNYNFNDLELIKKFPTSKKDVLFPYNLKLNLNHIMDAISYCVENNIPFLWWNDIMFDWHGNILDIKYYDLPDKEFNYNFKL